MACDQIWAQSDYLFTNYSYLSEVTVVNFQNNGKISIWCVDKALPSDVQAKQWIDKCYSDSAPSKKMVKGWYADFQCGCTNTNDAECSVRPNLAVVLENRKKLHKLVLANRFEIAIITICLRWLASQKCYLVIWCLWCNCYRRWKWTRRHEFKSWTRPIAFHIVLIPLGKVWIQWLSLQLWVNSRADKVLQPWLCNKSRRKKTLN